MLWCSFTPHLLSHTNNLLTERLTTSQAVLAFLTLAKMGAWKEKELLHKHKKTCHCGHLDKQFMGNILQLQCINKPNQTKPNNKIKKRGNNRQPAYQGCYVADCEEACTLHFTPRIICRLFKTPTIAVVHTHFHSHSLLFHSLFISGCVKLITCFSDAPLASTNPIYGD